MVAWVTFVLVIAVALTLGIERVLARLGIHRADPAAAPRGIQDLLARLRAARRGH
ncbi:MAG: hypothetical protein QJR03_02010 [Sphaerobacter sp.]|nr:hypothetical protein [Sphaerobacter sp.]